MIKAILIDDEASGGELLSLALQRYCPEVEVIGVYTSPEEALSTLSHLQPDLVFLDVQMPHMSGFDFLKHASAIQFDVIFVSAYDKYAIQAIRFSALDYLLKPIDVIELVHAVERVKEKQGTNVTAFQYQSVLNNIQLKSGSIAKLAVPTANGIDFYSTQDIIYCKADGSYTQLIMKEGKQALVCKNLKDFEGVLTESGFCRVHHSYIINLQHVQKYVKGEGGYVILTDRHHVDISRRKKDEFLSALGKI